MEVPTKLECFRMMRDMEMMDHIVAHSLMVHRVSLLLSDGLSENGIRLSRSLVAAASLLHDITKTRGFSTGENHAMTGDAYLRKRNFPEVGSIVGEHVHLRIDSSDSNPTEAEIVNYADKRVLHDQVVTLDKRMAYILERYGKSGEMELKLKLLWEKSVALEKKLFAYMPFAPDCLDRHIDLTKYHSDLKDYAIFKKNGNSKTQIINT